MMDSTQQHWLPLLAVIPFITAIFSMFGPKRLLIPGYMAFFILEFSGLVNLTAKVLEYKGIKYNIGGWETPLGIALYAGILTVFMLWLAYILKIILTFYALGYFSKKHHYHEKYFMVLWFFLFGSLNVLFLSDDIFNMYVGLELTGLSSVALIAAANSEKALSAALRYLYVTVTGSLFYLFGVAVIYLNTGTLDVKILAQSLTYSTSVSIALVMILTSLFLKTALFPFHFWLPPAHSNAITPVSAVLSALVIKATFYLIMRYLFEIMPAVYLAHVADIMLVLGSMAIIYGSVMSYRSERMKLLIAYSTVAQVGYLFLIFAICRDNFSMGFIAGVYHLISHAFAKTVFFMAAGNMLFLTDNDEIKNIKEMLTVTPATFFALAVAGFSLIGLPPSGGFISKWLLLQGAIATGNWIIVLVICTGSLLAAAYMFKVLKQTFAEETVENKLKPLPAKMEIPLVVLAIVIILLGLFSYHPLAFLEQQLMGVV